MNERISQRILCLDYGTKRIGVAVSDELGLLAHPLTTLKRTNRSHDIEAIASLVHEERISQLVIGLPIRTDGTDGPESMAVRRFAKVLQKRIPDIEMAFCDERYSTVHASERLREGKRGSRSRRNRIDQSAAAVILQTYLDAHRDTN